MANSFSKEEVVAFEQILEGFDDKELLAKKVRKYQTSDTTMERASDIIWRPQPYIAQSFNGMDQTANFGDKTQLSVPATLGFEKSSPFVLDAKELRDQLQEGRLGQAAAQKLASDVNVAIMNVAALQSTLVVPVSTAAGDYDDVALCDSIMNEQGIDAEDRYLCLASRDYNGMAGNLAQASRSFGNSKSDEAYEKGYVGNIAGFHTAKLDYANRITAAAGGGSLTINTQVGGSNFHTPVSTSTAGTGEVSNVDNRYQVITISSTTNVVAGDCFTIAGVEALHHITKNSTGQLKTFRVISNDSGTTLTISPPIVSNQGSTDAEAQYQNVDVTTSATAAIVFLNTTVSAINPFWAKDALEILPGRYAVDAGAGVSIMRETTASGIDLVFQKFYDINTMKHKYRLDTLFGVVNKQPEMSGILLFNQA
jgi:hypothetical protein